MNILYEDNDILVCHKSAGLPTQTAKLGQPDVTTELKKYLKDSGQATYLGLVHRLDQPVEGILVLAKTENAAKELSRQVANHEMQKYYYAIVSGIPKENATLVDSLWKDNKTNLSKVVQKDNKAGKRSELSYTVEKTHQAEKKEEEYALLKIALKTGRHHQIRVQLSHAGYPLLGDSKYGDEKSRNISNILEIKNVALCAYRLEFMHPKTKKQMKFELEEFDLKSITY